MRNRTSDLRIPRSDALPLSHRDSTKSGVISLLSVISTAIMTNIQLWSIREGGPREGGPREGGPRERGPREGGPREGGPRNVDQGKVDQGNVDQGKVDQGEGGPREGEPREEREGRWGRSGKIYTIQLIIEDLTFFLLVSNYENSVQIYSSYLECGEKPAKTL